MQWSIPNPVAGEKRTRKRFAFEPVTVTDKSGVPVKIWLEFYLVTEEFVEYQKEILQEWKVVQRMLK